MASSRAKALSKGQAILLGLLHALGGRKSNLDFQRLLFLYCQDQGEHAPYSFIPYRYGAFSYVSYEDRRRIIERGYMAEDDKNWILTEAGRRTVVENAYHLESTRDFTRQWGRMTGNALIAETYRRFPYFATRSESAPKILCNEPDTLDRIEQARPRTGPPGLVTIGYEGRSLDAYLVMLHKDGVDVLCDVRRNAISRKYGFSKRTLASICKKVDIQYEHLPQLGIASEERRGLRTHHDYTALFRKYKQTCLPSQKGALHTVRSWLADGRRVALTCYELQPGQCHRHCVTEALQKQVKKGIQVKHL